MPLRREKLKDGRVVEMLNGRGNYPYFVRFDGLIVAKCHDHAQAERFVDTFLRLDKET